MLERELKLHVPGPSREPLANALRYMGASDQRLRARYFDTQDRDLARAGIALRLRLEGEQWVQTLKAPGPDELSRIELNHPRSSPELDLTLYKGSAVEPILAGLQHALKMRYETDVNRLTLVQETSQGVVELACDRGVVRSGNLVFEIWELELELVSGHTDAVFTLGRHWLQQYGLILDLRSKAERGDQLARSITMPAPRRAGKVRLQEMMTVKQAYAQCLGECVSQIIRNATSLAGVDTSEADSHAKFEYAQYLRVGMRRLRSCLKFYGKWEKVNKLLNDQRLRDYFSFLGEVRDQDVLRFHIAPQLAKAGMPDLPVPAAVPVAPSTPSDTNSTRQTARQTEDHAGADTPPTQAQATPLSAYTASAGPAQLAGDVAFQLYLLDLLETLLSLGNQKAPRKADKRALGDVLGKRLKKWLKQICKRGIHFEHLTIDAQHDLRKKLKRLRYCVELSSSVLPDSKLVTLRPLLRQMQHTMGDLNDLYNAEAAYLALAATDASAFKAVTWVRERQCQIKSQIEADFKLLTQDILGEGPKEA